MNGRKRQRPTLRTPGWRQSNQFRDIASRAIRIWNATRARLKRCSAKRRSDGGVCQQWPMENGRCYLHGGRTPKGSKWHRPQLPQITAKVHSKLSDLDRRSTRRVSRVARMTPEQRADHARWHVAHQPGDARPRRAAREARRQNIEAASILHARPATDPPNPELIAITQALTLLEGEAERLRKGETDVDREPWREGVFG
jgi:hypothetical protein